MDPEAYEPSEEQFTASVADNLRDERPHRARARLRSGIEREFAEREALDSNLSSKAQFWRDEVADRVEGYRTKRAKKRLSGEFSMKLDFEPRPPRGAQALAPAMPEPLLESLPEAPPPSFSSTPQADDDFFGDRYAQALTPAAAAAPQGEDAEEEWRPMPPLPGVPPAPAKPPARASKLIEFPRSLVFPEFAEPAPHDPNELAEAVFDRPRILDVPEIVPVPDPALDVAIEAEEEEPAPAPGFELPLQVAPLPHRFTAALLDGLLVLVGLAMFALTAYRGLTGLPHTKPVMGLALAIPVVFWALYHYLFFVYAGATPGMRMAHIRMSTFEGGYVPRSARRWRSLLLVLSCVSLGFGFLWALFDEDTLCWHDKMTRTYLTPEN